MNESHLKAITAEQRKEMQEKAAASRLAKKERAESLGIRQDFGGDEIRWRKMASDVGFRLAPTTSLSDETKYIKRLLKHLGKEWSWYQENSGYLKAKDFYNDNPTWPAYALQGLILEDYFTEEEIE